MNKILIVEDDRLLCKELADLLEGSGYAVERIRDFSDACAEMVASDADLILLDISLPGENGEVLLQKYRKTKDTPVIMLTSRTGELDQVLSMSYGADDYVTKPYNPTILLLRISAILKRTSKTVQKQMYKDIEVSLVKGSLVRGNEEQVLTKNEMIIFGVLFDHQGEIVSRDELMTALWDSDEYINDNALSVNISRLRNKLSELGVPDAIETRKKQGYLLRGI
ncbi:MAG: response regulator transcription factor [Lachnospiraceae bacterium]|nr:response regulator transcription factor [Lachnospiraceae bacterium]